MLIVVLKSCFWGRNYLFLGSEQKIYFTFMNYVRWPTVLIFPELRNFLWYRIFSFKTGRVWSNGNDFVTESLWHFSASSVQSLSCVQLFATPWTAACQASVSITNSRSLLKLTFLLHLLRRCSGKGLHLAMTGEPRGFSRVTAGFSCIQLCYFLIVWGQVTQLLVLVAYSVK